MHSRAGGPPSRRRFLALSAGGVAAGGAALNGCALPVSSGVGGSGETVTLMVKAEDLSPELIKQAQQDIGVRIVTVKHDITKLIAMLTGGNPPDPVRGVGAVDAPYFAARDVAEELDPYFAGSSVLKADDLDPVNDLWRYDGRTQGKGPRYGMVKDFSQDSMYWYNTAHFDEAGIDCPPESEPVTYEEWLIFWRIFLPQSWPVLSASFVIAFTWTWGDYIAPQLLLSTDRSTLAVAVMSTYVTSAGTPVTNLQAAASVMYVVPILLIFLVAQRGFVAGMSTSGLK